LPPHADAPGRASSSTGNVRVNLAELDDLIARANELFRDTTNAVELAAAKPEVAQP